MYNMDVKGMYKSHPSRQTCIQMFKNQPSPKRVYTVQQALKLCLKISYLVKRVYTHTS